MGTVSAYPDGTFCWVNLGVDDVSQAASFYRGLHGWDTADAVEGDVSFTMCRLAGHDVTAIYQMPAGERAMVGAHWNSFVSVDDIEETTRRAAELGATIIASPADTQGRRLAVVADPTGALLCLWQPAGRIGAGMVNETGTWTWNDLATRDPDRARSFYADMFGWQFTQVAPDGSYFSIGRDHLLIGGMRTMDADPPDLPAHWMPYFVVAGIDAAADRLQDLGGKLLVAPRQVPAGAFLVFTDPAGATSALFEMGEGPSRGVDGS
jgi:hypothetical protein